MCIRDSYKNELESDKSYIEVDSSKALEPNRNNLFVSSITFSIPGSLKEGEAIKFFTKYNADKKPYVGWGLRLKKKAGTIRPEIYWQGDKAKGGWYSFAEIKLNYKKWSTITLIASKANSISLYYQNLELEQDVQYLGAVSYTHLTLPTILLV